MTKALLLQSPHLTEETPTLIKVKHYGLSPDNFIKKNKAEKGNMSPRGKKSSELDDQGKHC